MKLRLIFAMIVAGLRASPEIDGPGLDVDDRKRTAVELPLGVGNGRCFAKIS